MKLNRTIATLSVCLSTVCGCDDRPAMPPPQPPASDQSVPATSAGTVFKLKRDCWITSVVVPPGYDCQEDTYRSCGVFITPEGRRDTGIRVGVAALEHEDVIAAKEGRDGYRDFRVGDETWRLAIPQPRDISQDSFMAVYWLKDVAVCVYGADLGWTEDDLRQFLAGVQLGEPRADALVEAYHRAEPPGPLFVEVSEAQFVGEPGGWRLLYYDFVWSGAQDSSHGTQKLLIFDQANRYVGNYYLGEPLNLIATTCKGNLATIVLKGGDQRTLDFTHGPPKESTDGRLLYHPAEK